MARKTDRAVGGVSPHADRGNFVSEWYGHRVYPVIAGGRDALAVQKRGQCPFLSRATAAVTPCVKPASATGVCTISSTSNGKRQDWLVCPHRVLGSRLLDDAAARLFGRPPGKQLRTFAAPTLTQTLVRAAIEAMLRDEDRAVLYLRSRLGGEISVPQTDRSPEFSFDITLAELTGDPVRPQFGKFGVLEVQTMDFHGPINSPFRIFSTLFAFTTGSSIPFLWRTNGGSLNVSKGRT